MSDENRDLEGDGRCPFKRTSRRSSEVTEGININKSGNCTAIQYSIPNEIWYRFRSQGYLLVHLWAFYMRARFQLCIYFISLCT
jgi:hypothetical protein